MHGSIRKESVKALALFPHDSRVRLFGVHFPIVRLRPNHRLVRIRLHNEDRVGCPIAGLCKVEGGVLVNSDPWEIGT